MSRRKCFNTKAVDKCFVDNVAVSNENKSSKKFLYSFGQFRWLENFTFWHERCQEALAKLLIDFMTQMILTNDTSCTFKAYNYLKPKYSTQTAF